jgi:hypothetical protein
MVPLVSPALLAKLVQQALKVLQAVKALKEKLAHKDIKVLQVPLGKLVLQEKLVLPDQKVILEIPVVQQAHLG